MRVTALRWLRRAGAGLIILGAIVVVATVLTPIPSIAVGVASCALRPDDFDAEAWRANVDVFCSSRALMVDDLMAGNELRLGRPRAEVEQLLGPTEDTELWVAEDDGLVYQTSCWIDCNWLIVEFDDNQQLVKSYTAQD
jgi:hypothetical protein